MSSYDTASGNLFTKPRTECTVLYVVAKCLVFYIAEAHIYGKTEYNAHALEVLFCEKNF
jgi:hypothetical protein